LNPPQPQAHPETDARKKPKASARWEPERSPQAPPAGWPHPETGTAPKPNDGHQECMALQAADSNPHQHSALKQSSPQDKAHPQASSRAHSAPNKMP